MKFDGWRLQLHKDGDRVALLTRNGCNYTSRFPYLADQLTRLPARSAVIDGELVVCGHNGLPDFHALHTHQWHERNLCVWAFDLLQLKLANDERDTRPLQHFLGHKNIMHTVRYTELSTERFKNFWED